MRLIKEMRLESISLVSKDQMIHPEWRIEVLDGEQVEDQP